MNDDEIDFCAQNVLNIRDVDFSTREEWKAIKSPTLLIRTTSADGLLRNLFLFISRPLINKCM